jgi:hypothetical protein
MSGDIEAERKTEIEAEETFRAAIAQMIARRKSRTTFDKVRDWAALVQTMLIALAVLIGGYWTYHVFTLDEEAVPHMDIVPSAAHWSLDDQTKYVFVDFEIKNTGKTRLALTCAQIYIQQVRPVPSATQGAVTTRLAQTDEDPDPLPWAIVQQVTKSLSAEVKVIGPGETDHVQADFLVPARLQTAMLYGYIQNENPKCARRSDGSLVGSGWSSTMIYDLDDDKGRSK